MGLIAVDPLMPASWSFDIRAGSPVILLAGRYSCRHTENRFSFSEVPEQSPWLL